MDLKSSLLLISGGLVVVYCVLPLILFGIAAWIISRTLRQLASPDVEAIDQKYDQMRAAHPDLDDDELVAMIIRQQAFKCGVVGAITGFGGFVTLPVALPVDFLASMRIQATMVQFIAATYGFAEVSEEELRIRTALVMSGEARASRATSGFVLRFLLRFVSESMAKFVPLLGAVIGFAVDYAFARITGRLAQEWYGDRAARRLDSQTGPKNPG